MRWIDFRAVVYGGFLTIGMTSAALACLPSPNAKYDQFPEQDGAIAIANVVSVSAEPAKNGGACLSVSYTTKETLYGKLPDRFTVRSCSETATVEKMPAAPGNAPMGFVSGASVLLGLVKTDENSSNLRYAIPGCWGPLHIRLDTMAERERAGLLRAAKALLEKRLSEKEQSPRVSQPAKKPGSTSPSKKRTVAVNTGRFVVQISARKTEADAKAEFEKLKVKYPDLLGGYRPVIKRANLGKNQVWHRLYVGPIESKKAASSLCSQLKNAGMRSCLVRPELIVSKRP